MPSDRDLRAAVEALADQWQTTYCAKPRTLGFNDVFLRDLRAILAEHPATPAEECGHDWMNRGGADDPWRECYLCGATENTTPAEPDATDPTLIGPDGFTRLAPEVSAPAEPDAGGEGLTEAIYNLIADHPMWIGDDGQPLDYLPEREARISDFMRQVAPLVADRERRAEARGAERALQEAAEEWSEFEVFVAEDGHNAIRRHGKPFDAWLRDRADRIAGEGQ